MWQSHCPLPDLHDSAIQRAQYRHRQQLLSYLQHRRSSRLWLLRSMGIRSFPSSICLSPVERALGESGSDADDYDANSGDFETSCSAAMDLDD
jgi:hypothetical protein